MSSQSAIPSPHDFFLTAAPYQEFELNSDNFDAAARIQFFTGKLDSYCVDCQRDSVFTSTAARLKKNGTIPTTIEEVLETRSASIGWPGRATHVSADDLEDVVRSNRTFEVRFMCSRNENHFMCFWVRVKRDSIAKAGQTPSLADLQTHRIKKYRTLLGKDKWIEFSKAVGLQAHGVGIGGFVYLRRVFEHMIEQAHAEAIKADGWKEEQYKGARMEDKIRLLKKRLPEFLVRNSRIYPILGKGIHELSDDECLAMFNPIQDGIELILDEEIERTEKAKKNEEGQKALDALNPM